MNFDTRNALWAGESLRATLSSSRVILGGMGGLGWHIGAALVGLGVGSLTVFDPDALDITNLNRMWGVGKDDVGAKKIDLFAARALAINPALKLTCHAQAIPCLEFEGEVKAPCVIIGAFDKPEPRLACQIMVRLAGQTFIDVGVGFDEQDDGAFGRGQVFVWRQGGSCIVCAGLRLNAPDYFLPGGELPEPSSAALNGVLSHLAVLTWLDLISGREVPVLRQFSADSHSLRESPVFKRRGCPICDDSVDGS